MPKNVSSCEEIQYVNNLKIFDGFFANKYFICYRSVIGFN